MSKFCYMPWHAITLSANGDIKPAAVSLPIEVGDQIQNILLLWKTITVNVCNN